MFGMAVKEDDGDAEVSRRTSSLVAWSMAAASVMLLVVAYVLSIRNGTFPGISRSEGPDLFIPPGFVAVGLIVATQRRSNPIGWLFLAGGLIIAARGAAEQYAIHGLKSAPVSPGTDWAMWFQNWILAAIFPAGILLFLFLLFPNGRLPSRRWRLIAVTAVVVSVYTAVITIFDPSRISFSPGLPSTPNPIGIKGFPAVSELAGFIGYVIGGVLVLLAGVSQVLRYRRATGEEREQVKWFAFSALTTIVALIVAQFIPHNPQAAFSLIVVIGFGVAVPVSCAVAILKYGLYEIDVIISKTVLFAVLAALFTLVYVGVVVGIGAAVGRRSSPLLTVAAAAIIAVGFQPARDRARRFANRLVFGERATPYEVLSAFSERMAGTYALDDVLPRMARILGEGTGARSAEIWLRVGEELRPEASWPADAGTLAPVRAANGELPDFPGVDRAAPVRHQGELLGVLTITKSPAEPVTPAEDRLLSDLASQAGLVVRNAALTAELQANLVELRASRQRLVAAQDEERRRLERNLHDGAQQQLVAIAVGQRLAQQLLTRDISKAAGMLSELQQQTAEAIENLRDLARGIYPPLLADQGLAVALEAQARRSTVPVAVEAEGIGRYQQEIEACIYFCALEGLQNVAKYARASSATVRLWEEGGELRFSVVDDGVGFDPKALSYGTGLQGMADRLAALDGRLEVRSAPGAGTSVTGRLPAGVVSREPARS
jgi:signal transduction histidine kinase